jgi:hypothetical protein
MMQDPDTKKFVRDQQRLTIDQLYAPLIKRMGLTPEEAEQFKELLANNTMKGAERASSLFGGLASTNRAEAFKTLETEQKSFDAEVKAMLGDTRYARYQDYQQTAGERAMLNQFNTKQQIGGENPLTEQQTDQLLLMMKEEKQNVAAATGQSLPGTGQGEAGLQAMLSDEQSQKALQSMETVGQRVLERARTVLSPDQLGGFGRFLTNQLQMMRVGIKMFGLDKPAAGAALPNQ